MTWLSRLLRRRQMELALGLMLTVAGTSSGLSHTSVTLAAVTVPEKNVGPLSKVNVVAIAQADSPKLATAALSES